MKSAVPVSATRDSVLARLMEDYLASCEAGQPLSADELAARYPELATDVAACLASLDFIRKAAASGVSGAGVSLAAEEGAPCRERPPWRSEIGERAGQLGDFRIVREIGHGGMGVVYEAEQISLQRRVALKVLPFAAVLDSKQLARFKNEALAAAQLDHPHIVDVLGVGCDRGTHFYAMRFIDGRTLADVIEGLRQKREECGREGEGEKGSRKNATSSTIPIAHSPTLPLASSPARPLSPSAFCRRAAALIADAAEALHHAHEQGVIHRDIKPSNLMLDQQGKVWITDFGLARIETGVTLTMTGDLLGTLRYMSPEQALAKRITIDHRSDIYSLGATLYELLTLEPVFGGQDRAEILRQIAFDDARPPRKLNKAIPGELETIVLKSIEKNPDDRYHSAQDLADDLRRFLEDQPIRAKKPSLLQRTTKWSRRHRPLVVSLAAVLLLIFVGTGSFAWWQARQSAEVEHQVELVLQEATVYQREAKWPEAVAAVKRGEAMMASLGGSEQLRRRTHGLRRDLDMALELDEIRIWLDPIRAGGKWTGGTDIDQINARYLTAFRTYSIDLEILDEALAAQLVRAAPIREELLAALDHWARLLTEERDRHENWTGLLRIARLADTDTLRNQVRLAVEHDDADSLKALARTEQALDMYPSTLELMGGGLRYLGAKQEGLALFRAAQRRHPTDFHINTALAGFAEGEEVVRCLTVAIAIRPNAMTYISLAWHLYLQGRYDESIDVNREGIRRWPGIPNSHGGLGKALEAKGLLDEAIVEYRAAIRLDPTYGLGYSWLATALTEKGLLDEAIATYRERLRFTPHDAPIICHRLGILLWHRGLLEEADAMSREAVRLLGIQVRLQPSSARPQNYLARHLATWPNPQLRNATRAVELAQHAVELEPLNGMYWNTLGVAHYRARDWKAAIEALQKSNDLIDDKNVSFNAFFFAMANWQLGNQDEAKKWYDQAMVRTDKSQVQDEELQRICAEATALLDVKDSPTSEVEPQKKQIQ
jgi:serine/threonine protein kinase/Flp pilus assembly protein TadD